ncbi:hypothetical protein CCACVL1_09710 [Corchorus capsularis]|uniref:Uncharacterized protein n=1 Tax=Corchorus capsularis TaxID=210143 RepID=A0A1R3IUK0_COCAP|nr:hypothetical protein CCACVL1_09710 [Corchorus capsularis]
MAEEPEDAAIFKCQFRKKIDFVIA